MIGFPSLPCCQHDHSTKAIAFRHLNPEPCAALLVNNCQSTVDFLAETVAPEGNSIADCRPTVRLVSVVSAVVSDVCNAFDRIEMAAWYCAAAEG